MELNDRMKRTIAFYFSAALFLVLLPVVISYSLGYHIDAHSLKVYKTGTISLRSDPSGAFIYLNGRLLSDFTPARVENLKPGTYKVEVKRDKFYPWQREITVKPNMVSKAEDIVLFPINEDIRRITSRDTVDFVISDRGAVYYMSRSGLFRSDADGASQRRISAHSSWPADIIAKKFSPDGDKILYFNREAIWVIYLNLALDPHKIPGQAAVEEVLKCPAPIKDVFWYSDSRHIIFITDKEINAVDFSDEGPGNAVTLYKFAKPPKDIYYDGASDTLYFIDHKAPEGPDASGHIYKVELRQKFFDKLMKRLKKEFNAGQRRQVL